MADRDAVVRFQAAFVGRVPPRRPGSPRWAVIVEPSSRSSRHQEQVLGAGPSGTQTTWLGSWTGVDRLGRWPQGVSAVKNRGWEGVALTISRKLVKLNRKQELGERAVGQFALTPYGWRGDYDAPSCG